jgi:hypothetical protein
MSEEPIPYVMSEAGALLFTIEKLEEQLRHFDGTSMHLWNYVRLIDFPNEEEWRLVVAQIWDMVNPDGNRNSYRRSDALV